MSDSQWRSRIRWVVVHPHRPRALMLREAGVLALPQADLPGEIWTADATATIPALRELVGLDAVLLRCVGEHEDPSARVRQATLMAAPRGAAPLPPGAMWVGREDLAGAALRHHEHAVVAARVLDELVGGRVGSARAPWAAPGWFDAAERWLRSSLDTLGYATIGPVRQVRAWEPAVAVEARMVPRDLGPSVEHDADEGLGRVEAGDVALVREGGRLPLDGLGDAVVRSEDELAGAPHGRVQGVLGLVQPLVHVGVFTYGWQDGRMGVPPESATYLLVGDRLGMATTCTTGRR